MRFNKFREKNFLSKNLAPLQRISTFHAQAQYRSKPLSKNQGNKVLQSKLLIGSQKEIKVEQRILSCKRVDDSSTFFGINKINFNKLAHDGSNLCQMKQQTIFDQEQRALEIKMFFQNFLSKQALRQLKFPNFSKVKIKEFHPSWEMVDTIIQTYLENEQRRFKNQSLHKQIAIIYSHLSNELLQIRRSIFCDVEKLGKKQLIFIILLAFIVQIQIMYLKIVILVWKQTTGILRQFLKDKIQLLINMRRIIAQIFLCDSAQKKEIKVDKKIVKFISSKEKYLLQLKITTAQFSTDFTTFFSSQSDARFMAFNIIQVTSLHQVIFFEQKLKNKIMQIQISPFLKPQILNQNKFNLIIEPENFLYKEDKRLSTFLLRQGSVEFISKTKENFNVIIFSRLNLKDMNSYLKYIDEVHNQRFDAILDKKYLTYRNFKLEKNLLNLGLPNFEKRTIIIDPNYKQYISKQFWNLCFPIGKEGSWNQLDFLQQLAEKLLNFVHQDDQMKMVKIQL